MGKNKKRFYKSKKRKGTSGRKRRKVEKYWIEDFPEIPNEGTCDVTLRITRSDLVDDHRSGPDHVSMESKDQPEASKSDSGQQIEPSDTTSLPNIDTPAPPVSQAKEEATNKDSPPESQDTLGESITMNPEKVPGASSQQCSATPPSVQKSEDGAANENTTASTKDSLKLGEKREPAISVQKAFDDQIKVRFPSNSSNFRHLENGNAGDGILNPYDPSEVPHKYWAQRKRLFSRFEDGIQLDKEGWYSVTPETIAKHIAKRMADARYRDGMVVLDAFCGVGGNSIAFAARPEVSLVVCVDTNVSRLKLAANNCKVYEIPKEKVVFVESDAIDVLDAYSNGCRKRDEGKHDGPRKESDLDSLCGYRYGKLDVLPQRLDAIFLSPPWGGTEYLNIGPRHFSLSDIQLNSEVDGEEILRKAVVALQTKKRKNIAYFLPRNTNGLSFGRSAFHCGVVGCIEMEMDIINSKFKTITAYLDAPLG